MSHDDNPIERMTCYAYYYQYRGKNARSVLEIFDRPCTLREAGRAVPDIIFVMMNPGSSKAFDSKTDVRKWTKGTESFVQVCPDATQSQTAKIMDRFGFKHGRILNLSDLIDTRSKEFYKLVREQSSFDHSIFSTGRKRELERYAGHKSPVIFAWGVSPSLRKLTEMATQAIRSGSGWHKGESDDPQRYYHAFPRTQQRRDQWLHEIELQLLKRGHRKVF